MKHLTISMMVLSSLLALGGCASQGEPVAIDLVLKPSADQAGAASTGKVNVAVMPFGDDRSDRTKLGVHTTVWGTSEPLTLRSGTVGDVTARAFAEYLARKGWRARYVSSGAGVGGDDVVISGKVLESSVDAHGTVGSTDIVAKNKIVVHAKSQSDGSSITDTVSHNGTYSVFWYASEDAEEILSEVMEKNFDKFVSQTRFEGPALRFK